MNGPTAFLHRRSQGATGLMLGLTLIGAGGCADLRRAASLPPVNPESPVAPAVAQAVSRNFPRPRLQDVPPAPRNVPTADLVKVEVFGVVRCRSAIRSYARSHPQISHGSVAFATDQHAVAVENAGDAPAPGSAGLSEDLAARLRAFAAPPPAIASGPPPTPEQGRAPVGPAPPAQAPVRVAARPGPAPVRTAAAAPPAAAPMPSAPVILEPVPAMPAPGPDPLLERCS